MQYIATNVTSNIRELEGSLNKLIALHKLKNEEINIMLTAEALKDIINPVNKGKVTPELILEIVSEHYSISVSDLKGSKRGSNFVIPRQIAMYLCREMTNLSLPKIGELFGGRDHSTVIHACEKIADELRTDQTLQVTVNKIKSSLTANS